MSEHKYILEPYKGMNTRYRCPDCQQRDKTFSLYIDTETGEHIHSRVGRCNRESNCGYHYTPKQYFQDNNISFDTPQPKVTRMMEGKEVKQDSSKYRLIDKTTVIIEEPELNLHPALQSKLADLFLDVHQRFNIDFLIETHSEYILRRSQVIVAENEFEVAPNENPFCVHYFPKDIQHFPYRLDYQEDGSFNKNFGDGFFDEASSSTLELLKLKRQKKA